MCVYIYIYIYIYIHTYTHTHSRMGGRTEVVISIFFDAENISFDASLVMYINSTIIPPIIIINRMYENQKLLYTVPLIKYTIVVCISSISSISPMAMEMAM